MPGRGERGFTLIELSIVLVVIGLIVGGVLVGQSLISAAGVRATVSQIEKYNTAANTFRGKYGYLPGDIKDPDASSFGFQPRGTGAGQGDGNGILQGFYLGAPWGTKTGAGETALFWSDLSAAHLIDGSFTLASSTAYPSSDISGSQLNRYIPTAKVGGSNYIYVWSGGYATGNSTNYFALSGVTAIGAGNPLDSGRVYALPNLTAAQAFSIDTKMDDGLAQTGRVTAITPNGNLGGLSYWAAGNGNQGASNANAPTTAATPGSSSTCYDNGGISGAPQQYSVEISGGSNVNCALSFQLQAGD